MIWGDEKLPCPTLLETAFLRCWRRTPQLLRKLPVHALDCILKKVAKKLYDEVRTIQIVYERTLSLTAHDNIRIESGLGSHTTSFSYILVRLRSIASGHYCDKHPDRHCIINCLVWQHNAAKRMTAELHFHNYLWTSVQLAKSI